MPFHCAALSSSLGVFYLAVTDQALVRLLLPGKPLPADMQDGMAMPAQNHPLLQEALSQLQAYLQGKLQHFSLPLAPHGTAFQQAVWQQLCAIPYGTTRTYGEVAKRLGHGNKARAVGGAAHANPIGIIIPCHRMIGANGTLVGFGSGLPMKRYLLDLESGLPRIYC